MKLDDIEFLHETCEHPSNYTGCIRYEDQMNIDNPNQSNTSHIKVIIIAIIALFILNVFSILLSLDVGLAEQWAGMIISIIIGTIIAAFVALKVP